MPSKGSYARAGVDFDLAGYTKRLIAEEARTTFSPKVVADIGFFGSMFNFKGYRDPVLVSSVDGVGTKLKIAAAMGRHEGAGIDIVSHSVNDIFCCGAKPLYFLDYIAMGKLNTKVAVSLARGMAKACREVGMALVGGETAQMPGMYAEGEYDLVGFITGVVERGEIIDGRAIKIGDVVLGLPSSGLHTNGYSLVRKIFKLDSDPSQLKVFYPELGRTLGEALLEPHRCYYNRLKPVLGMVKGIAHITGGGMIDNIPRILPDGMAIRIRRGTWDVLPLFELIRKKGRIKLDEMFNVFNMGVGMVFVVSPANARRLIKALPESRLIGEVIKAASEEECVLIK
ncbi:MAG: phosphoribosylformylglycinamidine cyclo-ligase [Chloroflexota bacterium]